MIENGDTSQLDLADRRAVPMSIVTEYGSGFVDGKTGAKVVRASDGLEYIAKCDGWADYDVRVTKIVYQEWICARFAELIGVPIAQFQLLNVGGEISFGSRLHPNVVSNRFTDRLFDHDKAINQNHIYLIAVFDLFIGNADRHPRNLLHVNQNGKYQLLAIDHSHCPLFAPHPASGLLLRKNESGRRYI